MTVELSQLAAKLTEVQRDVVLHGWSARYRFQTMASLIAKGIYTQRICFPDGNGFPLTPLGLALRAHLSNPLPKGQSDEH